MAPNARDTLRMAKNLGEIVQTHGLDVAVDELVRLVTLIMEKAKLAASESSNMDWGTRVASLGQAVGNTTLKLVRDIRSGDARTYLLGL